jgi:hypothetical protein
MVPKGAPPSRTLRLNSDRAIKFELQRKPNKQFMYDSLLARCTKDLVQQFKDTAMKCLSLAEARLSKRNSSHEEC